MLSATRWQCAPLSPSPAASRFRGELVAAGPKTLTVAAGPDPIDIPYDAIVRGNLIDEVTTK